MSTLGNATLMFTFEERELLHDLLRSHKENLEKEYSYHRKYADSPEADWLCHRIEWVKRLAMKIVMG